MELYVNNQMFTQARWKGSFLLWSTVSVCRNKRTVTKNFGPYLEDEDLTQMYQDVLERLLGLGEFMPVIVWIDV